ncbi:hypothetical protein E0Z10_g5582 [Xylaria hypoxylon]|uniref:F-box domain-containing protein n=1 Tax=Xylaria hypoxylon TaxID=37992 RepID=A0A4Z0YVJ5_9PEZI|nr:hypothetical protein E0Z10_g5582 [Xylaria hypoxylon]
MDQLPLELLQRILTNLDLTALRNAALSCRTFFAAFKSTEVLITSEIFLRQINYDVLPEAILVNKSWSLGPPSVNKGIAFAENLKHREPAPAKWSLADALPLAQFHEKVSYLASQAAHEALTKQPRLLAMGEPPTPTYEEMCRFERALYRFQLYCNVVGRLFPLAEKELLDIFFEWFATWENEQLACIHEHLVRVVSKQLVAAFNYLVEHDVNWGYMRVPYIEGHWSEYAQGNLAGGIERIYYLSRALDYTQRHALLSNGEDRWDEPHGVVGFLSYGLEKGANPLVPPLIELSEMDEDDKELVCGKPFYEDPDPGPASMWEWVYRNQEPGDLVANPGMLNQRRWAFPFWDFSRLQAVGLLGNPEIPGPRSPTDPELEEYGTPERLALLKESRRERTKIRESGGTGFYSPQDLSKVKWESNDKIDNEKRRLVLPHSLEEAKGFLRDYNKDVV